MVSDEEIVQTQGFSGGAGEEAASGETSITAGGVAVHQYLWKTYKLSISAAGEKVLTIRQPFPCVARAINFRLTALDAGDQLCLDVIDNTTDAVRVSLIQNFEVKTAGDDNQFVFNHTEPLLRDTAGTEFDALMLSCLSEGATAKTFYVDIEYIVPDKFLLICDGENDVFFPATSDEKGADRAFGTALTSTIGEDTTNYKTGLTAISWAVTAANQTNDQYNGIQPVKSNNFNLTEFTTLYVLLRDSDKAQAEFGVVLEDSDGNYSYWTFTITANDTWERKAITLANPTGNGGTAADLTKIDKVWVYFQSKAAAADNTMIIDSIWCE